MRKKTKNGSRLLLVVLLILVTACKTKNKVQTDKAPSILVQLYNDSTVTALELAYKKYDLQKQKVVSRPMSIYLFQFDASSIEDTTLITLLKQSKLVKEAQRNGNVELRKTK